MKTEIKLAYEHTEEIKEMFLEYTQMVVENDPGFAEYLKIQDYDSELGHLADKYGLPDGRLYIVYVDEKPAGCIGLRKLDGKSCEMKRLYVRPAYRGLHIANQLVDLLLDDAKKIGYQTMVLDTFPFLEGAIRLYKKKGFYETESYNDSPMSNLVYLKRDL